MVTSHVISLDLPRKFEALTFPDVLNYSLREGGYDDRKLNWKYDILCWIPLVQRTKVILFLFSGVVGRF